MLTLLTIIVAFGLVVQGTIDAIAENWHSPRD
jgi:hypothetical protein